MSKKFSGYCDHCGFTVKNINRSEIKVTNVDYVIFQFRYVDCCCGQPILINFTKEDYDVERYLNHDVLVTKKYKRLTFWETVWEMLGIENS